MNFLMWLQNELQKDGIAFTPSRDEGMNEILVGNYDMAEYQARYKIYIALPTLEERLSATEAVTSQMTATVPTELQSALPIRAPDFLVSSPKPKGNHMDAHAEAIAEAGKANKSIALIVLDLVVYVAELEKRLKKAKI